MISYTVNFIGLIFDIVGAILLVKFGLLGDLQSVILDDKELVSKEKPEEIAKMKRQARMPKMGLALLITGFIFQAISDIIPMVREFCTTDKMSNCREK